MSVFAVVLRTPNQEVFGRLESEYPDHFRLSETFAVLATADISGTVATKIGIKGENQAENASGAVMRLAKAYSGFTTGSFWEWIGEHQDDF